MSPRMWFTLVLRTLGAYQVLTGLSTFVTALNVYLGWYEGDLRRFFVTNQAVSLGVMVADSAQARRT